RQAVEDMAALRLPIEGTDHLRFLPAAGVPWFVAPFGRDSLIASLQSALVYPSFARGSLDVLGSLQATERDDYRDAEPGKIMHELRLGELAHFKLVPHTPYYGTADATLLYLIVLHVAWRCTGDAGLLEHHLKTAEACLEWIDNYGDRDGDGFQEYATRSPVGYENQGWKDSGDSVVYPDGSLVKGPKALCELQGYAYDAWIRMAEIFDELGKADRARDLRTRRLVFTHSAWMVRKRRFSRSRQTLVIVSGLASSQSKEPVVWYGGRWSRTCGVAGAFEPFLPTIQLIIPTPIRTAQFGRTITASLHRVFDDTDMPRRLHVLPATSAALQVISRSIKCRNSTQVFSVTQQIFPFNISAPMYPRLGLPVLPSPFCRRSLASNPMPPGSGFI